MDLNRQIESAELKYKQILEGFFVSVYKENYLPSHGLSHHRRVWTTAKELIRALVRQNLLTDPRFPDSLIIACYLHDISMAVDHGPDHGKNSARITGLFLKDNTLLESDFPGLLDAVLLHDKKDYSSPAEINLRSVLSMADDLDAFGYTGIYRYIEIFAVRRVKYRDIGKKMSQNAANRYRHFKELMNFDEDLLRKHSGRYQILETFCYNFENDIREEKTGSGYHKVVDIITSMVQSGAVPEKMITHNENDINPVVSGFFKGLRSEMANI